MFHCMDVPQFAHPFTYQRTPWLLLIWGNYDWSCDFWWFSFLWLHCKPFWMQIGIRDSVDISLTVVHTPEYRFLKPCRLEPGFPRIWLRELRAWNDSITWSSGSPVHPTQQGWHGPSALGWVKNSAAVYLNMPKNDRPPDSPNFLAGTELNLPFTTTRRHKQRVEGTGEGWIGSVGLADANNY